MIRRASWRWALPLLTALVLASGLLALLALPGVRPNSLLARRWGNELDGLPDDQVPARLRQIAALGDAGIPILAEALASDREAIVTAARETLSEQFDEWATQEAHYATPKVAALAKHLALHAEQCGPAGRAAAANFATQILLWPIDDESADAGQIIANCESVLRATSDASRRHWALADRNDLTDSSVVAPASTRNLQLPREIEDVQSLRPPHLSAKSGLELSGNSNNGTSFSIADDPEPFDPPSAQPLSIDSARSLAERNSVAHKLTDELVAVPSADAIAPTQWTQLSHLEVMRWLRSKDAATARAASAELQRRGFESNHLELAMRLTDPDAKARREFAELLPRISGVDARPWLWWLTEDDDPTVRSTAISILATSGDAEVLSRIRQLLREETDAGVLRQAERILDIQRR